MTIHEHGADGLLDRRRRELGRFLRDRRCVLTPVNLGLRGGGRRHVKGLRREEVADLAGISFATYAAIEQGRLRNVTSRTLARIADVLRFSLFERQYIAMLSGPTEVGLPFRDVSLDSYIAFVRGYSIGCAHMHDSAMDMLSFNQRADELFAFSSASQPNLLVTMIENHELRHRLIDPDWNETFASMTGAFRLLSGTYPTARADDVIERLSEHQCFLDAWRASGIVSPPLHAHLVDHPTLGLIRMQLHPMQCPPAPTTIIMLTSDAPELIDTRLHLEASTPSER